MARVEHESATGMTARVGIGPEDDLCTGEEGHVSLCDALDRVLHKGVVVKGEVTISVADVELVYLGVQLLLASVETARRMTAPWSVQASESSPERGGA
jgi:hypothetical protein